jgi:hypothetical protein
MISHNNNKVDYSVGDVVSSSSTTSSISAAAVSVLSESEDDDESLFSRRNKRYRYVNEDLYKVTSPLPVVKAKNKMIKRKK